MKREQAIFGRWTSVVSCGVVAAGVWGLASGAVHSSLGFVIDYLASVRADVLSTAVLVLVVAACWPFGRRRWLAFLGLRHLGTYPPLWIAVAVALLIIGVYEGIAGRWEPAIAGPGLIWSLITTAPAWVWLAAGVVLGTRLLHKSWPAANARAPDGDGGGLSALITWLRDDHEISQPHEDRFGHDAVATRIAERLKAQGESPTMAVVGPLGSGKSTIRQLVEHHLGTQRSTVMVHLSLWPFDTPDAAVAGIIRSVIRALGQRVNVLAIAGLSERYVEVIERTGGRWGVLARLMRGDSRPDVILRSLATIATAAGLKLVLWIEDMERFTGADRLGPEDAAIREAERLGPILSLLVLLDRCDSISVIVGDTSLRSRLDVGKIARFVESPPRPGAKEIWRQIESLRSACLSEDVLDPASEECRAVLTPPESDLQYGIWLWSVRDSEPRIQEALPLLLTTPRSFKWALRITWETWERLAGEVDIDSVLVASALRVSRPELFAFIDEHVDLMRSGFRDPVASVDGQRSAHPVFEQLRALLDKENTERMRNAVATAIGFVFPAVFSHYERDRDYMERPQGLGVARHADYWQRYLTLPVIAEGISDQSALKAIAASKTGQSSDLVARLMDAERSEQVETFVGQFDAEHLCRLLTELVAVLQDQSARAWEDGRHAPGIVPVWRMMHRRQPPVALLGDTLVRVMSALAMRHLPLTQDIWYYFAEEQHGSVSSLLDDVQRERVRVAIRGGMVGTFKQNAGDRLLQAMHHGSPWVVWYLCMAVATNEAGGPPFDGWDGISEALLEAVEQAPITGLPLVVPFFTSSSLVTVMRASAETGVPQPRHEYATRVDLTRLRLLFDFDRLGPRLAETPPPDGLEPQLKGQYEAARGAVAEVLKGSAARAANDDVQSNGRE
ncbi:MAG: hypothetical protein IT431_01935 [Phycisphaerales bacterium]|nr:hypothetical protein [Phycisphaerales bacterium]